jgi:hypothetical protein
LVNGTAAAVTDARWDARFDGDGDGWLMAET